MLLNRFIPIVFPMAIVGSLASKKASPETAGTLRTDTPLFGCVLFGCVLFVGALLLTSAPPPCSAPSPTTLSMLPALPRTDSLIVHKEWNI